MCAFSLNIVVQFVYKLLLFVHMLFYKCYTQSEAAVTWEQTFVITRFNRIIIIILPVKCAHNVMISILCIMIMIMIMFYPVKEAACI